MEAAHELVGRRLQQRLGVVLCLAGEVYDREEEIADFFRDLF